MNLLRHDLLKHFFLGFFIFILCQLVFSDGISFAITIIIGSIKELIYDYYLEKCNPELLDLIYTVTPALILIIIR